MFCGPEILDASRGEAEGNNDSRESTKQTAFPRFQSISISLYTFAGFIYHALKAYIFISRQCCGHFLIISTTLSVTDHTIHYNMAQRYCRMYTLFREQDFMH